MGFSRREYWNGCRFLLQGIFLTHRSPAVQADSLPLSSQGNPKQKPVPTFLLDLNTVGERRGTCGPPTTLSAKSMFGQNHLTQSLFYNKVLNVSCNLLNAELKVETRMLCGFSMVASALLLNVKFLSCASLHH